VWIHKRFENFSSSRRWMGRMSEIRWGQGISLTCSAGVLPTDTGDGQPAINR
jgi:hypothetical protein